MHSILDALREQNAVLEGKHFVYASGKHGAGYVNLDLVYPDAELLAFLCGRLIEPYQYPDVVAAPAVGAIALVTVAAQMASQTSWNVPQLACWKLDAVWADKVDGQFDFVRAGFSDRLAGRRVLVLEDVLNTGGSVRSVVELVKKYGGNPVGVSVICTYGTVTAEMLGVPQLHALARVGFKATSAADCPLCRNNEPIVLDVGHGADFQHDHPDYPGGFINLFG